MSDINKIKTIHELKEKFEVNDTTIREFIDQIENSNFKENIERFFRGYKVEDNFHLLFSSIPWVKLIHELGQNQLPSASKEKYQVADFMIYYETSKKEIKPLLLEIKSVKGDSQSLELMTKQLNACVDYSKVANIPFLYAIYWEKYQTWTLNAVENFEVKTKQHKIKIFDAVKNDISVILGDITFYITQPIYRKTVCDNSIVDESKTRHVKYGAILSTYISMDNTSYAEIQSIESAIVDSSIKMKIIDTKVEGSKTIITEVSDSNYFLKLSTLILRHLALFSVDLNEKYADTSRRVIIEFFKKLGVTQGYSIPNSKTPTSDILYNQAFAGTGVLQNYLST